MRNTRIRNTRALMADMGLDAMLITHMPHVRYLTGFTGSNGLCVLTASRLLFITDGRYRTQAREEVRRFRTMTAPGRLSESIRDAGILRKGMRTGFQSGHVTVGQWKNFRTLFPGIRWHAVAELVERAAIVKDEEEIGIISQACGITDAVFDKLLTILRPGITELDVAAEITYLHRKAGAEADAFEPIVASGENGALPHARPTSRKLRNGDLIVIDMGCRFRGYHSDLTRTVLLGKARGPAQAIYMTVSGAQQAALDAAREGIRACDLDEVARGHIRRAGYGSYFGHSLGHGIGLQIHEGPAVSRVNDALLRRGSVLTIEPGIYLPGVGGVRIEDDVAIERTGCRILTQAPKALIQL